MDIDMSMLIFEFLLISGYSFNIFMNVLLAVIFYVFFPS